jgi:hypothetical protein
MKGFDYSTKYSALVENKHLERFPMKYTNISTVLILKPPLFIIGTVDFFRCASMTIMVPKII